MAYQIPAWQNRLLSASEIVRFALNAPNIESPAMRLARSGFDIAASAEAQRMQSESEISAVYRRRGLNAWR
jgi:hypothetical protein